MMLVYGFPEDGVVTRTYFYMVLLTTVATSFTRYETHVLCYGQRYADTFIFPYFSNPQKKPLFDDHSTVAFVSMGAFMTVIADPVIGGTYMTVSTSWLVQRIYLFDLILLACMIKQLTVTKCVFNRLNLALEHAEQLWRHLAPILCS